MVVSEPLPVFLTKWQPFPAVAPLTVALITPPKVFASLSDIAEGVMLVVVCVKKVLAAEKENVGDARISTGCLSVITAEVVVSKNPLKPKPPLDESRFTYVYR